MTSATAAIHPINHSRQEAAEALKFLRHWMPAGELLTIKANMRGEEGDFFINRVCELRRQIEAMPAPYKSGGHSDPTVHLHYFTGGMNWYILERDSAADERQLQAFGLADLYGDGGELGYISIAELISTGVELDLHWTAKPLSEVRKAGRP